MKDIEEQLKEFHTTNGELNKPPKDFEIPKSNPEQILKFKNMINNKQPKKPRRTFKFVLRFALPICCLLLLTILSVPVYNHFKAPTPPPVYYTDGEATKVYFTDVSEPKEIINNKKSKYNFIFEECFYLSSTGYYSPKTNELLAISIRFECFGKTLTNATICIVFSDNFKLIDHDSYLTNAEKIKTETYTLYKKGEDSVQNCLTGYVEYSDYKAYITLNSLDNDLFEKFL